MSLAAPWALALAALALPVVAAYFHRKRKTPLRVPSAILLRAIAGLERHLHHLQGDPGLALRAVRESVWRQNREEDAE